MGGQAAEKPKRKEGMAWARESFPEPSSNPRDLGCPSLKEGSLEGERCS